MTFIPIIMKFLRSTLIVKAAIVSYCHVLPVVTNSCHEPHIPRSLPVTIIKTSKKAKTFLKTSIKTMTPAHMWNINKAGQCWAPVS